MVVVTIAIRAVDVPGQAPLPVNDTMYLPGALAAIFISPVVVLTNFKPGRLALKVPPDGLLITGVGLAADTQ